MFKPMTRAEWQEFCGMTLHGTPPWETLRRIYATVDQRDMELDKLRAVARGTMRAEVERLSIALRAAHGATAAYGQHHDDCDLNKGPEYDRVCDCGWEAVQDDAIDQSSISLPTDEEGG